MVAGKLGCTAQRSDGSPCNAPALRDRGYCLMHDPESQQEAAEARRLGGLRRRREHRVSGAYEIEGVETVPQIRRLLQIAVLDTLGLENSVARSRTIAYLAQVLLRVREVGELEDRVKALEDAQKGGG